MLEGLDWGLRRHRAKVCTVRILKPDTVHTYLGPDVRVFGVGGSSVGWLVDLSPWKTLRQGTLLR